MNYIETKNAPPAIGPYSQAVVTGGLLYASGQIPIVPSAGDIAEGGITVQTDQACRNVGEILKAAGLSFEKVVKTTCFLADIKDFAAFNEVYEKPLGTITQNYVEKKQVVLTKVPQIR